MCIIIYIPTGKQPPTDDVLKHCWEQNPHNGGFMYVTPHENIKIRKATTIEQFLTIFHRCHKKHGQTSPFVIHFRYATNGSRSLENTHPFRVNSHYAFVHNGRITNCIPVPSDGDISDTAKFNKHIMRRLPLYALSRFYIQYFLEYYISRNSKIVIMSNRGVVDILNEEEGEWVNDIWYSNDYYKTVRKKTWPLVLDSGFDDAEYVRLMMGDDLPKLPPPPKTYNERKGGLFICCNVCGHSTQTTMRNLLIKFPNSKRMQRADLCDECYNALIIQYGWEHLFSTDKCEYCNEDILKTAHYRRDFLAVTLFTDAPPEAAIIDSKCAYTQFKKATESYSTGYIGWALNPVSVKFLPYEEIKQYI